MRLLIIFLFCFSSFGVHAQEIYCSPCPNSEGCNNWLLETNNVGPFFVLLKFHITSGVSIEAPEIQASVDNLNTYFNPDNIFFGWDCSTIYDNYDTDDPKVLNVEILANNNGTGFTGGGTPGTRVSVSRNSLQMVLAHEIGHCLGLWHVYHAPSSGNSECPEHVDGSDCDTCGDCICDTDAIGDIGIDYSSCTYTGNQVDPAQVPFDPGVETVRNIMHYVSPTNENCQYSFTPQQANRMRNMLANAPALSQLDELKNPNVYLKSINANTKIAIEPNCNNGQIDIAVNGGIGGLSYIWSNGSTSQNIDGLIPGNYCVTVTDQFCNSIADCFEVTCPCLPAEINKTFVEGLVDRTQNLIVSIDPIGVVTFPITVFLDLDFLNPYYLNSEQDVITLNGLNIGANHCLTFSDGNGCIVEDCFIVEGIFCKQTFNVRLNRLQNDLDCFVGGDGFINIDVETLPTCDYSIRWNTSPVQYGTTVTGLSPGNYCVSVEGNAGASCEPCLAVKCWDIKASTGDALPIKVDEISFNSFCSEIENVEIWNGTLIMNVSGGTGNYNLEWSDGNVVAGSQSGDAYSFIFFEEGTYCVKITDDCGELLVYCYTVEWERYEWVIKDGIPVWQERACEGEGRLVQNPELNSKTELSAKPNPFTNNIHITVNFPEDGNAKLKIFNALGRSLVDKQIELKLGENLLEIPEVSEFSVGVYFIQLLSNKERQSVKVLKIN